MSALPRMVLASLLVLAGVPAFAGQSYSALYVFGDSYADVGNIYLAHKWRRALVAALFPRRVFQWADLDRIRRRSLGLTVGPSLAGGTDYAFGGALVNGPLVTPQGTVPSVPQEVGLYLTAHGGKADPHALYVIEGGGNDILAGSGSPEALGFKIAVNIALSELALRQAGARHFLIPNLFNVGLLPAATGHTAFAAAATKATNQWVSLLLNLEAQLEGVSILRIDTYALLNAIVKNPAHYGFENVTTPCLTTTVCANPDQTLFWDVEHLTESGQLDLAATAVAALTR